MQAERNRTCSKLLRRSLSYAKIMPMSAKRIYSQFAECSLSSTKIMPMSAKRIYSQFAECSLSYAKIDLYPYQNKFRVIF